MKGIPRAVFFAWLSAAITLGALLVDGSTPVSAATTFTVNTVDDLDLGACTAAHCSLREAINAANVSAGADSIVFNIAGPSPHKIQPTSPLPDITGPVNIDGGSSPNCGGTPAIELSGALSGGNGLRIDAGPSTVRGLVINGFNEAAIFLSGNGRSGSGANVVQCSYLGTDVSGTSARPNAFGVEIVSANNLIGGTTAATRNVISGNSDAGVRIEDNGIGVITNKATGNVISGNYIGTDVTGSVALGNHFQGVFFNGPSGNTVGGTTPGAGNVISGNQAFAGIEICCNGGVVLGNYIGTDATGTGALGNSRAGILITGSNTTVGGSGPGSRNIISGNGEAGVDLTSSGGGTDTGNKIRGNYIGTNAAGTAAIGNSSAGVGVGGSASGNFIGGAGSGEGNLISGNNGPGVSFEGRGAASNTVQGNLIGVKGDGASPLGNSGDGIMFRDSASSNTVGGLAGGANTIAFNGGNGVSLSTFGGTCCSVGDAIEGNSIYSNVGLGIDLAANGVTLNDIGDPDSGPNNFQNFPVVTAVAGSGGNTIVQGTLNSQANTSYRIELFSNTACDPSGYGEGQTLIGFTSVTTDGSGNASFAVSVPGGPSPGSSVTATATDPVGNTSEFSKCGGGGGADLSIAKSDSPDPVLVGQQLAYTLTVTDHGPLGATGVSVTDALPATVSFEAAVASQGSCAEAGGTVTCHLGSVPNNGTAQVMIFVTPTQPGTITNSAQVVGNEADPDTSNNSAQASTTVSPAADLTTTKTADSATASAGTADGYTITVSNSNTFAVTLNSIFDDLPDGFTYTAGSTTDVTTSDPAMAGQQLTWTGPFTIADNSSVSLHFGVTVSSVPGDYFDNAGGDAGSVAVVPTGPTAKVTVTSPTDPPITATGATVAATEGIGFNSTVATFTDPDTNATAGEYSATINWGDGSPTSAGTVSGPTAGTFTVTGSHTYADEGSFTTTVVITDPDTASNTAMVAGTATVADAALTAGPPVTISATEGMAFSGTVVGSFNDANLGATTADFTATINWGDGSTTAGAVSGPTGGPFTVSGSHTYIEEGSYTISVMVTDDGGSSATLAGTATVADAPLSGSCATPVVSGTAFAGPTATFTDHSSTGTLSDFSATINWGDGSTSTGAITGGPGTAPYTVSGTHTYATPGFYVIITTITDVGGSHVTVACGNQTFVFPPSTPGCDIDGAGRITAANGDKATFTVEAELQPNPPNDNDEDAGDNEDNNDAENVQTYRDLGPTTPFSFKSTQISSVTCNGHKSGSIYGSGTVNGTVPVFFIIDVTAGGGDEGDNQGNGNRHSTYRIRLSNGYDSGQQRVRNGKIQVDIERNNSQDRQHGRH